MTTARANILVVDDTLENLRLLSSMLGHQGYEVRPVTSGRHALKAVEHDPPDLILLDINMPEMSGYEVCAELKKDARSKDIPVIFLTALTDVADKVKAFATGGIDYITKPFQMEEVHARVRTHLTLRRASRELEASYAKLREAEKLRDDLVHMIVHDMRSPLMVLVGHLDLVRENVGATLNQESRDDLFAAVRAAQIVRGMANDLLDVSKLEEGKLLLKREACDLGQIVHEVSSGLGVLDRGRTIRVSAPGPVAVGCDVGLVRRVVENLVTNAIKHTPAGGAVEVSITQADDRVKVSVADEGRGVPPEARSKIFEKFGTLASPREARFHSAGLGLAFAKLAIEAHGGAIGLEGREPRGSIFWFELAR